MQVLKLGRSSWVVLTLSMVLVTALLWWISESIKLRPIRRTTMQGEQLFLGEGREAAVARLGLKPFGMDHARSYRREKIVNDSTTESVEQIFAFVLPRVSSVSVVERTMTSMPIDKILEVYRSRLTEATKGSTCSNIQVADYGGGRTFLTVRCDSAGMHVKHWVVVWTRRSDSAATKPVEVTFGSRYWI